MPDPDPDPDACRTRAGHGAPPPSRVSRVRAAAAVLVVAAVIGVAPGLATAEGRTGIGSPAPIGSSVVGPSVADTGVSPGQAFASVPPTRILDSRGPVGGWGAPLAAGSPRDLTVTGGPAAVPVDAAAVVLNVTVTGGTSNSFLTAYPAGATPPTASNLNFAAGQTTPNLVTVAVGDSGQVTFVNTIGSVHVVADLVGYYAPAATGRFQALVPVRLLDSRTATGGWAVPLNAGTPKPLVVRGVGGVPPAADAVVLNLTATGGTTNSFLTAYPSGGQSVPNASNVNFGAGETIANLAVVQIGPDGSVMFGNAVGAVDVVADVVGFYQAGSGDLFHALVPDRILDSRSALGGWNGPLTAGTDRDLQVAGAGGVGADATAVVGNLTVTGSSANSFVTVYPTGTARPTASNVNFATGQTIPNLTTVGLGSGGSITLADAVGSTHVVYDVVGYFAPT